MKRSWWKVTAYCTAASLVSFYLYVYVLGRFALVTTPDGAVTADSTRVIIVCGILFAAIVAFGGAGILPAHDPAGDGPVGGGVRRGPLSGL